MTINKTFSPKPPTRAPWHWSTPPTSHSAGSPELAQVLRGKYKPIGALDMDTGDLPSGDRRESGVTSTRASPSTIAIPIPGGIKAETLFSPVPAEAVISAPLLLPRTSYGRWPAS
jgi:hypothetical protein